jgi:hypothetical protein
MNKSMLKLQCSLKRSGVVRWEATIKLGHWRLKDKQGRVWWAQKKSASTQFSSNYRIQEQNVWKVSKF